MNLKIINSKFKYIIENRKSHIPASINYIKKLNLDYVVFGSSRIENIQKNIEQFKN